MRSYLIFALLLVSFTFFSSCKSPSEEPENHAPKPNTGPAQVDMLVTKEEVEECDPDHALWGLTQQGEWRKRCYDKPLPFDAEVWARGDKGQVYALSNTSCDAVGPVVLWTIEDRKVSRLELSNLEAHELGRGSSMVLYDDHIYIMDGENCTGARTRTTLMKVGSTGLVVKKRRNDRKNMWAILLSYRGLLIQVASIKSLTGLLQDDPLQAYLRDDDAINRLLPLKHGEDPERNNLAKLDYSTEKIEVGSYNVFVKAQLALVDPEIGEQTSFYNRGYYLSRAFGKGRLVISAGLGTPLDVAPDGDFKFELFTKCWALNAFTFPRRLPPTPVIGDGVSMIFDSERERFLLLDPTSDKSFVLREDDRAWLPISHSPHPAVPKSLHHTTVLQGHEPPPPELPVTRAELRKKRSQALRFTHHEWPYFAFFDQGEMVVVPLAGNGGFCRPVRGTEEIACLKSFP